VFVHCSNIHYAIIQASSVDEHPERFVIAYPDENCLRDLIAAPSIIGVGFTSRADALANIESGLPDSTGYTRERRTIEMSCAGQEKRDLGDAAGQKKGRKLLFRFLQCALSTAIVFVYSKNLIGAIIRQAVSF